MKRQETKLFYLKFRTYVGLTIALRSAPLGFSENWMMRPLLSTLTNPKSDARLKIRQMDTKLR